MRVLFIGSDDSEVQVYDNVEDFLTDVNDETISMEKAYYGNREPAAYFLPDNLDKVDVRDRQDEETPRYYVPGIGDDTPTRNSGESLRDYALRILQSET
jgi:hypothetical protein